METVPSPPTGSDPGRSAIRAAPTGGGKSPKSPGGEAAGSPSVRHQAGPKTEARSDGQGLSGGDGIPGPRRPGARSESGAKPSSAKPHEDLRPPRRGPKSAARSRESAKSTSAEPSSVTPNGAEPTSGQPTSAALTTVQPRSEPARSTQAESKPHNPATWQVAVAPGQPPKIHQYEPKQSPDRGPRVVIGSVDVQVVMDSPEPASEKVASRPQPYVGSSRANRLYQRRF